MPARITTYPSAAAAHSTGKGKRAEEGRVASGDLGGQQQTERAEPDRARQQDVGQQPSPTSSQTGRASGERSTEAITRQ